MDDKKFDIPDIEMEYESIDMITSALNANDGFPHPVSKFKLDQNYPNPFNPYTLISWQLAETGHTELTVFNLLGEKVITLVSGDQNPGSHSYRFDGRNLPNGIYYYRLISGQQTEVKKMILLR